MPDSTVKTKALGALPAAVMVLLTGWAYWPALHGGWVWDDLAEVPHNAVLRDPGGLPKIWFAPDAADYFPLKTTVQWVEWHLWGGQPFGYHLVNLGLHVLSALLLWRLLRQLGVRAAWAGGLLFAVHPLAVESVAWISELKNTLSLPLLLLAMICYVEYDEARSAFVKASADGPGLARPRRYFLLSLAWFLAAMLSKSAVVMFPVVLLLYAWWRRRRIAWADLRASAPFFAIALGLGLVTVWFQQHRAASGVELALGGCWSHLAAAGLAVAFYVSKCLLPIGLIPHYPRWNVTPPSAVQFLPWAGLAAVIAWLWTKRAGWGGAALFGLGWFLINLAPVLGFVPMAYLRISWVADHFAYLSLAAAAGLAGAGLARVGQAAGLAARPAAWPTTLVILLAAALAIQSHRYARIFRSDEAFWTYTVERNPGAWMAQNDLGLALVMNHSDRLPEAMGHYEAALRLKPDYDAAYVNLGNALVQSGRAPEAIGQYEQAVRLKPGYADAHAYLGVALAQTNRLPEAVDHYEMALRLNPDLPETENNLGNALARLGRPAEAAAAYAQALRLRPDYAEAKVNSAEAHYQWANGLANAGRLADAVPHYEEALRLRPDFPAAQANLGLAFASLDHPAEGIAHLREALRLQPGDPLAHAYLGFALGKAGQLPEAIAEYEQALRLKPDDADVRYQLALALRAAGRSEEAQAQFEAARRLQPGRP